jgi:hypothetical protein
MGNRMGVFIDVELSRIGLTSGRSTEGVRFLNHSVEHSSDSLPGFIQVSMLLYIYVFARQSMVQPSLCFHRFAERFIYLIHKRCHVSTPRPSFGQ